MRSSEELYEIVKAEVLKILDKDSRALQPIGWSTSLVDDLGLDSLEFIDLTLGLEAALELEQFPMQDWADDEIERSEQRFTFASLVGACSRALSDNDGRGNHVAQHE
jgi:acyl carrier protein